MSKTKKSFLISLFVLILIAIALILFISPITKYLVEKYDEKYTGRQITMNRVYVNPYTGYLSFKDLKIFESKSDSVFISIQNLNINFNMLKLLSKKYEISELQLDHPRGIIIQNKKLFNFTDLIEKFSTKDTLSANKEPIHFNILNVKINDGEFYYREKITPINYFIKNVNIESTGKRWDSDTIAAKFSFISGIGTGDVKANCTINLKTLDYKLNTVVHNFSMNIVEQYLKALANYGSFSAILNADMRSKGNFRYKEKVTTSGTLAISDFHFGKNPKEDYVSFDNFNLAIKQISPSKFIYSYDSVSLVHPYLKYERYDYLDNLQTIFGKKGSNISAANADSAKFNLIIEIANYVKTISRNLFKSNYKVDRLAIYNADIKFNDFSKNEKFSIELNPLTITADSVNKDRERVKINAKTNIKPYGNMYVSLSINPKDPKDFNMLYDFNNLPIAMFNPYIIPITSFPLDRGTAELNGSWNVKNGIINSNNHLIIIDPRVGNRLKNKKQKWIPMRLIMYVVRERGNVIDYQVPITGNLNHPKFQLKDILFDAIKNILVKPPTTPYRLKVKNIESEIENSLILTWQIGTNLIQPSEVKVIKNMAKFLSKNPNTSIIIHPQNYEAKEKEYIIFFEAKKKYYSIKNNKQVNSLSISDLLNIERMSVKDSIFIKYLNKHTTGPLVFTIQEKCTRLIGAYVVNEKYAALIKERAKTFITYFKNEDIKKQIKILSDRSVIPYNGYSCYKIEYKGEFPKSLLNAYQRIKELNNTSPRNKYKKNRKENNNTL